MAERIVACWWADSDENRGNNSRLNSDAVRPRSLAIGDSLPTAKDGRFP